MLSVNAVGEPLAGKPHEWFDGRALETEQPTRHLRSPGRCAEKRHHHGLGGDHLVDHCHRASARPYTARTVR